MVDFIYKRKIRIREMAFGKVDTIEYKKCDVEYLHSNDSTPQPKDNRKKIIAHEQYTLENDLTNSEEEIFNGFNKNYRYEIRRADKEGTQCLIFDGEYKNLQEEIDEFEIIYNNMFISKGLNNKFNRSLVVSGLESRNIIISKAYINDKDCKVYHAYLADGRKTMLMYSASTLADSENKDINNLIGWMNKRLHWFDMLWFKKASYSTYEWGGINSADEPNGIARFKMGFGGEIKKYINYLVANSLFGKIYIILVKKRDNRWK